MIRNNWLRLVVLIFLFIIVTLPRILAFSPSFVDFDEAFVGKQVNRMTQALLAGNWPDTANNGYPAVTLMWLEALRVQTSQSLPGQALTIEQMLSTVNEDVLASLPSRRLVLALLNAIAIFVTYWLLCRLYNNFVAITAVILIGFAPFLLYRSRLFHPDGLTAVLMLLSILTILLYTKERKRGWLVASGILGGLATLTKITSLYLLPFTGLVLFLWPWLNHYSQQNGESSASGYRNSFSGKGLWDLVRDIFLWGLVFGLTIFVFWPALWVSPIRALDVTYGFLRYAGTGDIWQGDAHFFFQGQVIKEDPGVSFYLWALAYRTTPFIWLGIALALIGVVRRIITFRATTLLLFAYGFFYFIAMSLGATKADRYLLPIFPALAILAAVGYFYLVIHFGMTPLKKWATLGVLFIGSAFLSLPHHPYYSTYWNPLLGGGRQAVKILPVVSSAGVDVLIDYLNGLPNGTEINLAGAYLDRFCPPNFAGNCLKQIQFMDSNYFITFLFPIQWQLTNLAHPPSVIPDVELVKKFTKDGVDYAWLYKMPEGLHNVDQRLDEYGHLHGYRPSETEIGAGDPLEITIFWQNGKEGWQLGDSEFLVKLMNEMDEVQQTVSAQLKPEFTAYVQQPEMTLGFIAHFDLPPDISPGIYHLEIGLRLKTTGKETWNFRLANLDNTIVVNRGVLNVSTDELSIQHRLDYGQSQETELAETGLTLLGYNVVTTTSRPRLDFYWRAERPITENYLLNLSLLDNDSQTVVSWSDWLAPQPHPLTTWQPGEIVRRPWSQEVGYSLPPDSYQPVLTIFTVGDHQAGDLTTPGLNPLSLSQLPTISLPVLPENSVPSHPDIEMQHHLDNVTFGPGLDLLGYDLEGKGNSLNGTLYVTLYWLNRQPFHSVEAQVQVLDEDEQVIVGQILPIPTPDSHLTWRSVSHYELPLTNLPQSITIATRPIGIEAWYKMRIPGQPVAEQMVIEDVLSKTVIVLN